MTYGPFHSLRCNDDIAAVLLDDADDEQSRTAAAPFAPEPPDRTDSCTVESGVPSFLSNEETDATAFTGPAASDNW